jgi:type I restriction enzyme S subunit
MRSDPSWRSATLGDIVDLRSGKALPDDLRDPGGDYPVMGANGEFGRSARPLERVPVITIGRVGASYGAVHRTHGPAWVADNALIARPSGDNDFLFAYYLLQTCDFRSVVSGSSQPLLTQRAIASIPVAIPPPRQQTRIAAVLGALDDKIDSNRRLAGLLEETAATLFRARFVDFVGVDELEASEIGPIPRGWSAGKLSDLVDITMGQSPPGATYTDDRDAGMVLVQGMGGFGVRYPTSAVYTSQPARRAGAGATLMTVRAPVGAVNIARTDVCLGRGVCGVASAYPAHAEFLIRSLRDRWGSEESGTIFPAVNKGQVAGLPVLIPPSSYLADFEEFTAPLVSKLALLHDESETLSRIHDDLLPKLISGQIRVPHGGGLGEPVRPVTGQHLTAAGS